MIKQGLTPEGYSSISCMHMLIGACRGLSQMCPAESSTVLFKHWSAAGKSARVSLMGLNDLKE